MEDERLNQEFGDRLKSRRKAEQLSQEQLAVAADLSRTSIVNIERGRQGVSLGTLFRLADALGCEPSELLPLRSEQKMPRITIGEDNDETRQAVMRVMAADKAGTNA